MVCLILVVRASKINKKTKAILPVHWSGRICNMKKIKTISSKYKVPIVEDACHAISATYYKNFAGKFGDFGCFSLHPLKNLNVWGDGGFVIVKNVPTENNFIVKFANSIGSVRRTNFGEHFNVKSKSDPNDLAYTTLHLSPHTDNPYRNPVPCIQILHCIENEVSGGFSTLVDGYTVTENLKQEDPEAYKILTEVKVRFKFTDKNVVLEDWSELIHLDENKEFKQVRFSPRLDYVPILEKNKLDLYYKSRKKLSDLYNSKKNRVEFKLAPKDLMMMDNYRVLHGRTKFDPDEGKRFLQGCYIDFDSTEGKLRHLKRKFKI